MAKKNKPMPKRYGSHSRSRSGSRVSEKIKLKTLAYRMGQIERGRQNSDSLISHSYQRGLAKPEKKRTLF